MRYGVRGGQGRSHANVIASAVAIVAVAALTIAAGSLALLVKWIM